MWFFSCFGWVVGDEKVIFCNIYGISGLYGFFQNGVFYFIEKYGIFWFQGVVFKIYQGFGGSGFFFGFLLCDQYQVNGVWIVDFEGGSICIVNGVVKVYCK